MNLSFVRRLTVALLALAAFDAAAAPCPTTSLSPSNALPAATVGSAFSQAFTANNLNGGPFTFSITGGLPAGSGLGFTSTGATTANLAGSPALAGTYLVTLTATDSTGCSGGRVYPLTVGQGSQTITFGTSAPSNAQIGGAPYAVTATATSALPVTLTIDASASAVCAIAGGNVTFTASGTCVINANQAGNANWNAAPQAQQSFAVGLASQTITYTSTAPSNATFNGTAYSVAATASSGLGVTFTIDPTASSVCTIAGNSVSFIGTGTCVVNANQAGNATYAAAPQVQQTFTVAPAAQTITFSSSAPSNATYNGTAYSVAATATSSLAVTFTIDPLASGVCTIAGSSVSFIGTGTCVVNANQAGNANYSAAPQVQQTFTVAPATQTITFTSSAPSNATYNGTAYSVAATATSSLAVTFTIDPLASGVCTIAGSSVSFIGTGTCVVNANQAGNANYSAAPQVQQTFTVAPATQTITFTSSAPSNAAYNGTAYSVAATATSSLPVTLTIDPLASGVCSIAGSSVSFIGVGTCVVNANQAGNANYTAAPQVQQTFTVAPAAQTITFTTTAPTTAVVSGATYDVAATATSGLTVTLTIDASAASVCSIAGSTVSFIGAGTCVVNANQAGGGNYAAAPQAQQSMTVGPGSQTITFGTSAPTNANAGGTYAVTATATSGLPVTITIDASAASVCSIAASTVSFTAAGTCVVNANQAGDANWSAAPQVQQSFTISNCLTLALGEVATPSANFCVNGAAGADTEYTYLPINNSTSADATGLSLLGTGIQAVTGPPSPRPGESAGLTLAPLADEAPLDMHAVVGMPSREPLGRAHDITDLMPLPMGGVTPLTVGQLLDLNMSVGGCGATPDVRKARVEAITTPLFAGQQVLYAVQEVVETTTGAGDWHPAVVGGFQPVDFQNLMDGYVQLPPGQTPNGSFMGSTVFKLGMLDTMTNTFGAMTDVDNNGGIVVLFTRKMNELSPPASSLVVNGMYQPRDLFSAASCGGSNQGEYLYMMVPDPTGVVNSNVRTVSFVFGATLPTLVHHFEHLQNAARRLYFNGGAPFEQTWLDEGLAWLMQEQAFFNMSVGLTPRSNIQLSTLTTGPNASVRVAAFNTYENTMYGHLRSYFYQLGSTNGNKRMGPLRENPHATGTTPTVHENVASNFAVVYSFLRYALDRKNTGDAALLSALMNSTQNGRANLQAVLNVNLDDWARDFLVGAYTDDSGVGGVGSQYALQSWNFRSVFGGLGGFPLATNPLTDSVALNFVLGPGGGTRYTRFGVVAGGTGTFVLTQGGGAPAATISGAIVRTK